MMNIQGIMKQAQMMQKKMEEAGKAGTAGNYRHQRRRFGQNNPER